MRRRPAFHRRRVYGLVSQIRRASVSVPANIAEGYGRNSRRDYAHHLRISRASAPEVGKLVETSERVGILPVEAGGPLRDFAERLSAMLFRLEKRISAGP
jgi:four helix bundle protein